MAVWAKTPVNSMPTMPPIPWQGKTSRVSSILVLLHQPTTRLLIKLANTPIKMLIGMLTKPAAGVMATSPTTMPMQNPIAEGFLPLKASNKIQAKPAAAAEVLVVAKATAARLLAPTAEPVLKPNQPNHNKPVPNKTKVILAGVWMVWALRLPKYMAAARAAQPAEICTTVPPAKSSTPILNRKPSGCQVQCAIGA